MSDSAPAINKKSPKKKATGTKKPAPSHPTYVEMIKEAVQNLKESKGSSKAAILKYVLANYKVGDNLNSINSHLRLALKRGVTTGSLRQVKGHGASGSFKLADSAKEPAAKKKSSAPAKKAASPKKKTSPKKKKAAVSAPVAEVEPAKAAKKASPKKKKVSPKKAAKPKKVAKSPKKSPAKKVVKRKSPKKK